MENSPPGTLILQVYANDTDSGRNGQLFYSALGGKIENLLAVDGATGKVYNSFLFDFETMETPSFNVTLVASDNGFPQKSGVTIVQITVKDENDNCPSFTEPSEDLQLEISGSKAGEILTKVSATDLDNGVNSDITYTISANGGFSIDPKTGIITVTSNLTDKEYHLTVRAADNGEVSCFTEVRLTVKVTSLPTTFPSKKPPSSSTEMVSKTSILSETLSTASSSKPTEPAGSCHFYSRCYKNKPP